MTGNILKKLKQSVWRPRSVLFLVAIIVAGSVVAVKVVPLTVSLHISKPTKTVPVANSRNKSTAPTNGKITFGLVPGVISGAPEAQAKAALTKMKAAGFTQIRVNVNWASIETTQGNYDWKGLDTWLQHVHDSGMYPILEIDHIPSWNRPAVCKADPNCIPLDTSRYSAFASMVVNRYKQYNVAAYEIWNEENSINFWKPFPNPNHYAHMLSSANIAIKKADPKAVVLLGGLSGDSVDKWGGSFVDPRTYLAQVYGANGKDTFDAVGYHPYIKGFGLPDTVSPFNGWSKMTLGNNSIRNTMVANGDKDKSVWITEFGVTTGGKGAAVTEPGQDLPKGADHASLEAQAKITQAVLSDLQNLPWVTHFVWYNYEDAKDAATSTNGGYGLWKYDGQPKPALDSIKNIVSHQQ